VFFLLSYLITLIWYWKNPKAFKIALLAIFCIMWLLSGRIIGFKPFPDGRVNLGWYCFEFQKFCLCNGNSDCEIMIAYKSKVEPLSFWRLRIKNENVNRIFFIGPFTWKSSLKILETNIGTYRDRPADPSGPGTSH
jgi:hypothetical protein